MKPANCLKRTRFYPAAKRLGVRRLSLRGGLFLALAYLAMGGTASAAPLFDTHTPITFFTNVASRLLSSELNVDMSRIQVYPTNQYTPAVHRLLQVTANIYDATTTNRYPTVFRPLFSSDANGGPIFISGYEPVVSVTGITDPQLETPLDAGMLVASQAPFTNLAVNVYGIPWVIGAKKGLPNFNQFYMRNLVQVTRKLEVTRPDGTVPGATGTNQLFLMSITNQMGFSFWNSYNTNYVPSSGSMNVYFRDVVSMGLTDSSGAYPQFVGTPFSNPALAQFVFTTNYSSDSPWPGSAWNRLNLIPQARTPVSQSFYTGNIHFVFLPKAAYQTASGSFLSLASDVMSLWDTNKPVPVFPHFGLTTTNWIQAIILDGNHVIDYVQMSGPSSTRDISYEIADKPPQDTAAIQNRTSMWDTNGFNGAAAPTMGVVNQIAISRNGSSGTILNDWERPPNMPNFNLGNTSLTDAEAAFFNGFFVPSYVVNGKIYHNTNTVVQAPYTPTRTVWQFTLWQANDPLVHYLASDLETLAVYSGQHRSDDLILNPAPIVLLDTLNLHYQPWGRNAQMAQVSSLSGLSVDSDAYNSRLRDPLVWGSDDWNFPTGQDWSLNWLGRVHRGTPWQTIYLKSSDILQEAQVLPGSVINIGTNTWEAWMGLSDAKLAQQTSPVADRRLAGLLAAMLNTNNLASQFSVNNHDPNAWAKLMDGFVVLSNSLDTPTSLTPPQLDSLIVALNSPQILAVANAIESARSSQYFHDIGEILAVPELTEYSPYLNRTNIQQLHFGINDEAYEAIPSQLLPLLRADSFGSLISSYEQAEVQFSGYDGHSYAIQASPDLINWVTVSTNSPANGVFHFDIPQATNSSKEFYRSLLLQ